MTIHGDGEQSRDFTYVANVVEANILAMSAEGAGGSVLNIAAGGAETVNTVADTIGRLLDRPVQRQPHHRAPVTWTSPGRTCRWPAS